MFLRARAKGAPCKSPISLSQPSTGHPVIYRSSPVLRAPRPAVENLILVLAMALFLATPGKDGNGTHKGEGGGHEDHAAAAKSDDDGAGIDEGEEEDLDDQET